MNRLPSKPTLPFTIDYEHEDNQGKLYNWEIDFVVYPGDPGRYFGYPEDCYPSTPPEIEIVAVRENGRKLCGKAFSAELNDLLETACWEWLDSQEPDEPEGFYDGADFSDL